MSAPISNTNQANLGVSTRQVTKRVYVMICFVTIMPRVRANLPVEQGVAHQKADAVAMSEALKAGTES